MTCLTLIFFFLVIRQRLVPNLRDERILARGSHKISVQVDLVFELFEKYSDRRTKDGFGGGFHVVAGLGRPGLGPAFGPGRVAFTDDMSLIDDDEGAAVTRRHNIRVMEFNGFDQLLYIDSQCAMLSDTPASILLRWREIVLFRRWPGFPHRIKSQARDTSACRC